MNHQRTLSLQISHKTGCTEFGRDCYAQMTWSTHTAPAIISTFLYLHNVLSISLTSSLTFPYSTFFRYFGMKTIWCWHFHRGRVDKGNFTPNLSQNRTWYSRIIRLLSSFHWHIANFPMVEHLRVWHCYTVQQVLCSCQRSPGWFPSPFQPSYKLQIHIIDPFTECLTGTIFPKIIVPASNNRV